MQFASLPLETVPSGVTSDCARGNALPICGLSHLFAITGDRTSKPWNYTRWKVTPLEELLSPG